MTKKIAVLLTVAVLLFSGCSRFTGSTGNKKPIDDSGSAIEEVADGRQTGGYFEGKVEETMSNSFFEFTVLSAKQVESFGSLQAAKGNILMQLEVKLTNTFGEGITMYSTDFVLEYGENEEDYAFSNDELEGVMPSEFEMKMDQTGTYTMVFEAPADKDYRFSYTEFYEDEFVGNYFGVKL